MKKYKLLQPFYDTRRRIQIQAGSIFTQMRRRPDFFAYNHSNGIYTTQLPAGYVESNPVIFKLVTLGLKCDEI